jgi:hypothetical protein
VPRLESLQFVTFDVRVHFLRWVAGAARTEGVPSFLGLGLCYSFNTMSDDQPPLISPAPKPLEYYHSTEPAPPHPLVLALCLTAGLTVGGGTMIAVNGVCLAAFFHLDNGTSSHLLAVGIVAFLISVAFFLNLGFKFHRDRTLPFDRRLRGGRFFLIGFIIGCGLCFLLEGICFSIAGLN